MLRHSPKTQAQAPLAIRWGHGLTSGLVFSTYNCAADWNVAPVNYVNNAPGSTNTSITIDDGSASVKPNAIRISGKSNGTSSIAKHGRCNLSLNRRASFSWWAWWDTFANNDKTMWCYATTNWSSDKGVIVIPNESSTSRFVVAVGSGGGTFVLNQYARPSAAVWRHYGLSIDRNASAAGMELYFDGVKQSKLAGSSTFSISDFGANQDFNFYGGRSGSGTQLFGACRIACFNAWSGRYFDRFEFAQMMANSMQIFTSGHQMLPGSGGGGGGGSASHRWFLVQ